MYNWLSRGSLTDRPAAGSNRWKEVRCTMQSRDADGCGVDCMSLLVFVIGGVGVLPATFDSDQSRGVAAHRGGPRLRLVLRS